MSKFNKDKAEHLTTDNNDQNNTVKNTKHNIVWLIKDLIWESRKKHCGKALKWESYDYNEFEKEFGKWILRTNYQQIGKIEIIRTMKQNPNTMAFYNPNEQNTSIIDLDQWSDFMAQFETDLFERVEKQMWIQWINSLTINWITKLDEVINWWLDCILLFISMMSEEYDINWIDILFEEALSYINMDKNQFKFLLLMMIITERYIIAKQNLSTYILRYWLDFEIAYCVFECFAEFKKSSKYQLIINWKTKTLMTIWIMKQFAKTLDMENIDTLSMDYKILKFIWDYYSLKNDIDKAIYYYTQYSELWYPEWNYCLWEIYLNNNQFDKAFEQFTIAYENWYIDWAFWLAQLYFERKDIENEIKYLEIAYQWWVKESVEALYLTYKSQIEDQYSPYFSKAYKLLIELISKWLYKYDPSDEIMFSKDIEMLDVFKRNNDVLNHLKILHNLCFWVQIQKYQVEYFQTIHEYIYDIIIWKKQNVLNWMKMFFFHLYGYNHESSEFVSDMEKIKELFYLINIDLENAYNMYEDNNLDWNCLEYMVMITQYTNETYLYEKLLISYSEFAHENMKQWIINNNRIKHCWTKINGILQNIFEWYQDSYLIEQTNIEDTIDHNNIKYGYQTPVFMIDFSWKLFHNIYSKHWTDIVKQINKASHDMLYLKYLINSRFFTSIDHILLWLHIISYWNNKQEWVLLLMRELDQIWIFDNNNEKKLSYEQYKFIVWCLQFIWKKEILENTVNFVLKSFWHLDNDFFIMIWNFFLTNINDTLFKLDNKVISITDMLTNIVKWLWQKKYYSDEDLQVIRLLWDLYRMDMKYDHAKNIYIIWIRQLDKYCLIKICSLYENTDMEYNNIPFYKILIRQHNIYSLSKNLARIYSMSWNIDEQKYRLEFAYTHKIKDSDISLLDFYREYGNRYYKESKTIKPQILLHLAETWRYEYNSKDQDIHQMIIDIYNEEIKKGNIEYWIRLLRKLALKFHIPYYQTLYAKSIYENILKINKNPKDKNAVLFEQTIWFELELDLEIDNIESMKLPFSIELWFINHRRKKMEIDNQEYLKYLYLCSVELGMIKQAKDILLLLDQKSYDENDI